MERPRKTRSCCVTTVGGGVLIEPQTVCVFQARGLLETNKYILGACWRPSLDSIAIMEMEDSVVLAGTVSAAIAQFLSLHLP